MKKIKQLKKIKNDCRDYKYKIRKGNCNWEEVAVFVLESLVFICNCILQSRYEEQVALSRRN